MVAEFASSGMRRSDFARAFLVEPYANQPNGDILRILAAQNGTNISINGAQVATLNQGQFYQSYETSPISIAASAPISVAQYETSEEYQTNNEYGGPPTGTFLGDPSMTLIPANEQFGGHYTVLIPNSTFPATYVNVVAPTSSVSGLLMDGASLSATFTPIPGQQLFGGTSSGVAGHSLLRWHSPVRSNGHRIWRL